MLCHVKAVKFMSNLSIIYEGSYGPEIPEMTGPMPGPMFPYIPLCQNAHMDVDGSYAGSYVNDGSYGLF